ncbi:unnamed protein product [Strongylus vulgaris]|uniref:Mediator of RNA polymerase II transcription subunit 31 n=1 Tax=Strongylus vulgaris TaxID=40348 RepID=A0A3P7JBP1_STRVU|nr:unnamed protein product [Strongylus vulgaris]
MDMVQLSTAQLEPPEEQRRRFEIECEFVQALANPHYVNLYIGGIAYGFEISVALISISVLAQRGFLKEQHFINYLKYLLYWKQPEYARALKYPQCLHLLECLQCPNFREALTSGANAKFIEDQQVLQWLYYLRKRQRLHVCYSYSDFYIYLDILFYFDSVKVNPDAAENAEGKSHDDTDDDLDGDEAGPNTAH